MNRIPASASRGRGGAGNARSTVKKYNANGEHVPDATGKPVWCASEAEAERFRQLLAMQQAGTIDNLRPQVRFDLTVNGTRITTYVADFTYDVLLERGDVLRSVVEDVKGMQTPEFKIKRRLFDALQPVKLSIIEVKGEARHSTNPKIGKSGKPVRSRAGWMDQHWKNRIPD